MSDAWLRTAPWLLAAESRRILAILGREGRPSRFVGGCVRDGLAFPGRDVTDLDVATPLVPERAMALLRGDGFAVLPTGIAHGTITARRGGRSFEVTTLRRDVETDGRHAVVAFTDDFCQDAARRDFTINAMSCDGEGRLFDYFGGREDLQQGRIRFVGDPATRIIEDGLRILRFFRFYAGFGASPADAAALAACQELRDRLEKLAAERVWGEIRRLLRLPRAAPSLALMAETGVWQSLFGQPPNLDLFRALVVLHVEACPITRLAALLHPPRNDPARARSAAPRLNSASDRLRLSRLEREKLLGLEEAGNAAGELIAEQSPAGAARLRRLIYKTDRQRAIDGTALAWAEAGGDTGLFHALISAVADWSPPALPISGEDLEARGISPSPRLGSLKRAIENAWLDSDFRLDREAALRLLDGLITNDPADPRA